MSLQTRAARRILRRPGRTDSRQGTDLDWERIMVQITFAFVIILGYLVSRGVDDSRKLAAEASRHAREAKEFAAAAKQLEAKVESQEKLNDTLQTFIADLTDEANRLADEADRLAAEAKQLTAKMESQKDLNDTLQTIIVELKETEVGEAIAGRVAAERNLQLARLQNAWRDVRDGRLLRRRLIEFDEAELIPLSEELRCVPCGAHFEELNKEIDRVFRHENQNVKQGEIDDLEEKVLQRAGYDPAAVKSAFDSGQSLRDEVAALILDEKIPTRRNVEILRVNIRSDLVEERSWVSNLQFALLGKVSVARLDRLAALPLQDDATIDTDDANLGPEMLEEVLDDLRKRMKLLPEVADRVRQGGRDDPNKPAGSE